MVAKSKYGRYAWHAIRVALNDAAAQFDAAELGVPLSSIVGTSSTETKFHNPEMQALYDQEKAFFLKRYSVKGK